MPRHGAQPKPASLAGEAGPRAILRVPEVLLTLASMRDGASLAELSQQLELPKTSLHRLLKTLEGGGYVSHQAGRYILGPEAFRLATLIGQAGPPTAFPACARPVIEWLARETGESVMLGVVSDSRAEITYVDVIDSFAPLRFTVPLGLTRPLYASAAGKAVLAFLPAEVRQDYLRKARIEPFTPFTPTKADLVKELAVIEQSGLARDCSGAFIGADAVASPVFNRDGRIFCSVAAAGPSERLDANRAQIEEAVRVAGERVSRLLGYRGGYPPLP
jgi:DNA-binding IclR family transcriptional regulator